MRKAWAWLRTHHKTLRALPREHKTAVHMGVIAVIGYALLTEGGKTADWLFLSLSFLCEVG